MKVEEYYGDITGFSGDAIIVFHVEDSGRFFRTTQKIDRSLDGALKELAGKGEINGKSDRRATVHTFGKIKSDRVMVAGLGKKDAVVPETMRSAVAECCKALKQMGAKKVGVTIQYPELEGIDIQGMAQCVTEGAMLGLYVYDRHKEKKEDDKQEIAELHLVSSDRKGKGVVSGGRERGEISADAAIYARDMVNEPANIMTPTRMAECAQEVADASGLEFDSFGREKMEELGMGALLGVASGSHQPPRLIELSYKAPGASKENVFLVGKGITFDSGGISIKPSAGMDEMKGDMAGGAVVISAMKAIGRLKPKVNVSGIVPATENMPGGSATRPGDILKAMNGKTIEVLNTDAEGRLILADALSYARSLGATRMVDLATLTGACVVALGTVCTGLFGNDQELIDRVIKAGDKAGEKMWQLPLFDEYREQIRGDFADIKNVGGREAGAITAAMFLKDFAEDTPWVHLDIAGTSFASRAKGYLQKGGTGVAVRTLINLLLAKT